MRKSASNKAKTQPELAVAVIPPHSLHHLAQSHYSSRDRRGLHVVEDISYSVMVADAEAEQTAQHLEQNHNHAQLPLAARTVVRTHIVSACGKDVIQGESRTQ